MYDSRSDHPHKCIHAPRSWREMGKGDYIDYGTPRPRLLVTIDAERAAIAEGLDDLTEPDDFSEVLGLRRLRDVKPKWLTWDEPEDEEVVEDQLAAWEKELLDLPAETVWSDDGKTFHDHCSPTLPAYEAERIEDDWDDKYGRDPFLPLLTISEAYSELGEDGWHVESRIAAPQSAKSEHYVRVHQLARDVGIESRELIAHLRLSGEYVANHMSMVANPVADRVIGEYGRVPVTVTVDPLDALRERLLSPDAPAKVIRPGAPRGVRPITPRPGNRPAGACQGCRIQRCEIEGNTATPCTCAVRPSIRRPAPRPGNNPFLTTNA